MLAFALAAAAIPQAVAGTPGAPPGLSPDALALETVLRSPAPRYDDMLGYAVAADGGTIAASAPLAQGRGAVHVFVRGDDRWRAQAHLDLPSAVAGGATGIGLALHGDTLAVGEHAAQGGVGAVHVFRRTGDAWTTEQVLVPSMPQTAMQFGLALALDGDRLVVGAPGAAGGVAYVFERAGAHWHETARLSGGAHGDAFGSAVAIDGDALVVGAPGMAAQAPGTPGVAVAGGGAVVFTLHGTQWIADATLHAGDAAADDHFGHAVAIRAGNVAVAAPDRGGSTANDGSGAVYVFARQGAAWLERARLVGSAVLPGDRFGTSLALSPDGLLAVGARARFAYLFGEDAGTWSERRALPAPAAGAWFGFAVAISRAHLAVGMPSADWPDAAESGALAVYSTGYALRGQVTGLPAGERLALGNLGTTYRTLADEGGHVLLAPVFAGQAYALAARASGRAAPCLVLGGASGTGAGVVQAADVVDLAVDCAASPPTLSLALDVLPHGAGSVVADAVDLGAIPPGQSVAFAATPAPGWRVATDAFAPTLDCGGTLQPLQPLQPGSDGRHDTGPLLQDGCTVRIRFANLPPTFGPGPDQQAIAGSAAVAVPAWAGAIRSGSDGDSAQSLAFDVAPLSQQPTEAQLFAPGGAPTLDAHGTLRFVPGLDAGTATLRVTLVDGAGTAFGGVDSSDAHLLTIEITPAAHGTSLFADGFE